MVAAATAGIRRPRMPRMALRAAGGLIFLLLAGGARGWTYPPYAPYPPPQGQYGQYGQYGQPPANWQFPPVPPSNAQGVPPSYQPSQAPGYQSTPAPGQTGYQPGGWQGGYAQSPAQRQPAAPPRLEWTLDETQPYVQQNLLLRLELISDGNLTEADLDLPGNGDALFHKLQGPEASYRTAGSGRREVVNEFMLSLTPLRAGSLELPPIRINGTRAGTYGESERYQAVTERPIRLQVRPAMSSVQPWLPLKSLSLNASIDQVDDIKAGEPITLALEMSATGATSSQLPSLEDQLHSPDFRIYREQALSDDSLSRDGRELVGKRTEYYTLVPQAGGRLHLPEIKVSWWNVDLGARQVSGLPIRTLGVGGPDGSIGLGASAEGTRGGWRQLWLPFAALLLILGGYWAGVLLGPRFGAGRGLAQRLGSGLRNTAGAASTRAGAAATAAVRSLNPAPLAARVRESIAALQPASSRFLAAVRSANRAEDPADWCARFEQAARGKLRGPTHAKIHGLTEQVLALRPAADRAKLTRLMEQLDAALYGRQDIDFPRWKRDFIRQVGRGAGLLKWSGVRGRIRRGHLPALNPTVAAG